MPGPLLTVTISESVKKGQRAAYMLMTGHSVLELLLVIGFTFGLYALLKNPLIIRGIGIIGGLFLLWMGFRMTVDTYRGRISLDLKPSESPFKLGPIFQGITTSISNPYWTFWWATIGANYVLGSLKYGLVGLGSFYIGHILGDFLWYGIVAFAVVTGKGFLKDRVYRGILFACGLFLMLLAATFILDRPLF